MGSLVIRSATSDADLEAWRRVRLAVLPGERAAPVEEMRAAMTPQTRHVLAELDGAVVGSGLADRSSFGYAGLHPRVVPEARRRGIGTALLADLAAHAVAQGFSEAGGEVEDEGSLWFAERSGLREVDRQMEQLRTVGVEPWPEIPAGVEVVTAADRPDLWATAYEAIAVEAFADMVTARPIVVSREQWDRDWRPSPESLFLAIAVGRWSASRGSSSILISLIAPSTPSRPWPGQRNRGIATFSSAAPSPSAADRGVREVYTWTQVGNADMRSLNTRLGYRRRRAERHGPRAAATDGPACFAVDSATGAIRAPDPSASRTAPRHRHDTRSLATPWVYPSDASRMRGRASVARISRSTCRSSRSVRTATR